ncbi:hypothetical protein BB561_005556 [Smittium simulii]|uniref:Mitochondrial carrier n=1 Tax=Smittium simulii TaxID=133385 RepID=A0A2T9Y9S8_9FUNG|nr:hypothetical protein BB561_005556 [Smittium simulii]
MSAATAAICGVVTGYPFDSIKTRMQTYNYSSVWLCTKVTCTEEGLKGLYRGIMPPLFTITLTKSLSFSIYESTKSKIKSLYNPLDPGSLGYIYMASTIAGGVSGAFIAMFTCPLELVKIQMQLSQLIHSERLKRIEFLKNELTKSKNLNQAGNQSYLASLKSLQKMTNYSQSTNLSSKKKELRNWDSVKYIMRYHGARGFYSGIGVNLARDFLGSGLYFGTYEASKSIIKSLFRSEDSGPMIHMLAGGLCGVFAWSFIFPIDTIKSVYQKNLLAFPGVKQTYYSCFSSIYFQQGLRGLYKGVAVTLIRAFPIHALNFTVYEYVRDKISRYCRS